MDVFPATDCSGLTQWAAARCGIFLPVGSINQYRYCARQGTIIPLDQAKQTPGALVFIFGSDPLTTWPSSRHVGFSMGDGTTIDARKPAVDIYDWDSRHWGFGALIPGVTYDRSDMITLKQFVENVSEAEVRRIFAAISGPGGLEGTPETWIEKKATPDDPAWVRFWTALLVEQYLAVGEILDTLRGLPAGTLPTDLNAAVAGAVAGALGRAQVGVTFS
jgi:cell wall-associated NlpC family hydrolase